MNDEIMTEKQKEQEKIQNDIENFLKRNPRNKIKYYDQRGKEISKDEYEKGTWQDK